jgi:hypothetical protein
MSRLTPVLLFIIAFCHQTTAIACDLNTIPKDWVRLTEKNEKFIVFNSCDEGNLLLSISKKGEKFGLLLHGQQEDYHYEIVESKQVNDTVFINAKWVDSNKRQDFKFFWINKEKGLGRWVTQYTSGTLSDNTFVVADRQSDFEQVDQPCRECWGDECDTIKLEKPILSIKRVFDEYIKAQESTDSQEDKERMTKSLKSIVKLSDSSELDILINVWMYYDPTDFPCRTLVYDILENSRPESIQAVKSRISLKRKWETDNIAPYSELKDLLEQLDK